MTDRWKTMDRYVLISADTHAGADIQEYKQYLPSRWHDEFDAWAADYASPWDDLVAATAKRNWDSEFRSAELDADGIAGEVMFPNTTPPFFETVNTMNTLPRTFESYERRWAGLQAHNRWLLDFCALEPARRRGLAQILPHDVDAAVATIEWAASTGGLIPGVLLPVIPPNHPIDPVFHRRYDPIWRACEETGLALHQHGGTGSPDFPMDQPGALAAMFMEFPMWPRRTVPHLTFGGVFERFPNFKVVVTENGSILDHIKDRATMDGIHASLGGARGRSTSMFRPEDMHALRKPSDYVRSNVYYGVTGSGHMTPAELEARYEVGVDHLMWGNDYPHEEGTAPDSVLALRWVFSGLPVDELRMILAGNAAELYQFDLDALADVAERIGPTVEEVHTPLDATPSGTMQGVHAGDEGARPFAGGRALERMSG
jgi:predicted TIM-barrel fold metal-dependent hydrolase